MASLKVAHPITHSSIHLNKINPISDLNLNNSSLSVSKRVPKQISACLSLSNSPPSGGGVFKEDPKTEALSSGKIDEWMKESVGDIVKNLKEAPLLVHVYAEDGEGEVKIQTERAVGRDWPAVKSEWESGEKRSPDGLIYVGELGSNDEECEGEGMTRAWGVVVQGKGVECGSPACYLLKTSRVSAGYGMGLFCTHFCLARVTNFRDTALGQFQDCWLLQ